MVSILQLFGFWNMLAAMMSWAVSHSIAWAFLHFLLGYWYVLHWVLKHTLLPDWLLLLCN